MTGCFMHFKVRKGRMFLFEACAFTYCDFIKGALCTGRDHEFSFILNRRYKKS